MMKTMLCGGLLLIMAGCSTLPERLLDSKTNQAQRRSLQTRAFDTTYKTQCLRTVIATLQDLGFVITETDHVLGAVSAIKDEDPMINFDARPQLALKSGNLDFVYRQNISVTVSPHGETQLLVRASVQYGFGCDCLRPGRYPRCECYPERYQSFFTALEKAMFLTAHQVD